MGWTIRIPLQRSCALIVCVVQQVPRFGFRIGISDHFDCNTESCATTRVCSTSFNSTTKRHRLTCTPSTNKPAIFISDTPATLNHPWSPAFTTPQDVSPLPLPFPTLYDQTAYANSQKLRPDETNTHTGSHLPQCDARGLQLSLNVWRQFTPQHCRLSDSIRADAAHSCTPHSCCSSASSAHM